jgi:hypothetical protein
MWLCEERRSSAGAAPPLPLLPPILWSGCEAREKGTIVAVATRIRLSDEEPDLPLKLLR